MGRGAGQWGGGGEGVQKARKGNEENYVSW